MSMSDNDTNELDSYGVWVKHSSGDENLPEANEETPVAETTDDSLDLPDFDDSDFSDMFKDDSQFSADTQDTFSDDLDSTLSPDELANITSGDISIEETPVVEAGNEIEDTSENSIDFDFDTEVSEENPEEGFTDTDLNLDLPDDFEAEVDSSETIEDSFENTVEETSVTEDISIPEPEFSEDLNLDDFDVDVPAQETVSLDNEENIEIPEETTGNEIPEETSSEESFDTSEDSFDINEETFDINEETFDITEESSEDNISVEETSEEDMSFDEPSEESQNSDGEEEISLDDFMDGGFSDESVASGNNGFEEGHEPTASNTTEEVSLDDFVDMSEFGMDSSTEQKEEEIVEEAPLDMDISFDSSADNIETEENIAIEEEYDDETSVEQSEIETEEVSLNDFGNDFVESVGEATDSEIKTEEVDLSDFGIDSNAEETPIVQDVEESKNQEAVVDYDLSVGNENTASAPVVNEIKSDDKEITEIPDEIIEQAPEKATAENTEVVSTSLLQQIVADLSGLKDEINKLKSNLEEIKAGEHKLNDSQPSFDETTVSEPFEPEITETEVCIEEESIEDSIADIASSDTSGGFFDMDDTDDTIALSGAELDNIFNSAEFNEVTVEANNSENDISFEDTPVEDSITTEETAEEPVVTEEIVEEPVVTEETAEEPVVNEETVEETFVTEDEVSEDINNLPKEIPFDEEAEESNEDVITDDFDINTEKNNLEEDIASEIDTETEVPFEFENENLEEPSFDEEIALDESDDSELPDEISVPKNDDILVETNNSDFMDSVKDNTDVEEESANEIEGFNEESSTEAEPEIEVEEENDDIAFDTVDSFLENEEPVVEETFVSEEEVQEETAIEEEPIVENEVIVEESNTFEEVDNLNNDLSESNIDYLTTKEDIPEEEITVSETTENTDTSINSDLKKDIKSVLLYMDQLLENLPEEKIIEFAKSDEFSTYKKLFSELGLQ